VALVAGIQEVAAAGLAGTEQQQDWL